MNLPNKKQNIVQLYLGLNPTEQKTAQQAFNELTNEPKHIIHLAFQKGAVIDMYKDDAIRILQNITALKNAV